MSAVGRICIGWFFNGVGLTCLVFWVIHGTPVPLIAGTVAAAVGLFLFTAPSRWRASR